MNRIWATTMMVSLLALAGCGGGTSSSDGFVPQIQSADKGGYKSADINASSYDRWTYFSFAKGALGLTDEQAGSSSDWDIAFKRYDIKLNGGDSGPGNVGGALVAAQADFYNGTTPDPNVYLNATANSELEHLLALYQTPAELVFDELLSHLQPMDAAGSYPTCVYDYGWYTYACQTHALTLNDTKGWLLRSGEGNSYARFRATAYNNDVDGLDVTFSFDVQPQGESVWTGTATFTVTDLVSGGGTQALCFDFDGDSTVACNGTVWDLKLVAESGTRGDSYALYSNGGVSGAGAGGAAEVMAWADLSDNGQYPNGADADTPFGSLYAADTTGGVFVDENSSIGSAVFIYADNHKLYPNYRVFYIDTDADDVDAPKYLVQVTNYYSDTDGVTSGYPTVRWVNANTTDPVAE